MSLLKPPRGHPASHTQATCLMRRAMAVESGFKSSMATLKHSHKFSDTHSMESWGPRKRGLIYDCFSLHSGEEIAE